MKKSKLIKKLIDKNIKLGDTVFLKDGSALSSIEKPNEGFYIILPYPSLTKSELKLKELPAIVTEVEINNIVLAGNYDWCWLQDIIIDINGAKFRTASQCVYKKE